MNGSLAKICTMLALMLASNLAVAERFILVCAMGRGTMSVAVDTERQTVINVPARISDRQITWKLSKEDGGHYVYTVDRYSGSLTAEDEGGRVWRGECSRAEHRKF